MPQYQFQDILSDPDELRTIIGSPSENAVKKQLPALDKHCRDFISRSPFLLLGTTGAGGRGDVSPKGDRPGFTMVCDDRTLVIPDRPGNRRVDSLTNILENPNVGVLFMVPGMGETLRVNGTAKIVRDSDLLERMAVNGKRPILGIAVEVHEAYIHCAKAIIRSSLWQPETWQPVGDFPTLGQMLLDQTRRTDCTVEELDAQVKESYAHRLY
ncbi:MAG: pyridoxamine 5'-phosphate oxidase family protein [Dehalococcoidia bacterium]|nr:pyridoxamine 5'-phosphate oxidase family protein [Dehalococcoidia bacterium]MSQ35301.1 pyridoxamine 5'-phosphate oxidase family protein [Dehalococcoidia bacterium]